MRNFPFPNKSLYFLNYTKSTLNLRKFPFPTYSSYFFKYNKSALNLMNISKLRVLFLQVCKMDHYESKKLCQTQGIVSPTMLDGSFLRLQKTDSCVFEVCSLKTTSPNLFGVRKTPAHTQDKIYTGKLPFILACKLTRV